MKFECGLKYSCCLALEGSGPESETEGSEVTQSCPTRCNPMDCSLPGCSIHGIFPARVLEWVAISFSRGNLPDPGIEPGSPTLQTDVFLLSYQGSPQITILDFILGFHGEVKVKVAQHPTLCDPTTKSVEFSRQEYWNSSPGESSQPRD